MMRSARRSSGGLSWLRSSGNNGCFKFRPAIPWNPIGIVDRDRHESRFSHFAAPVSGEGPIHLRTCVKHPPTGFVFSVPVQGQACQADQGNQALARARRVIITTMNTDRFEQRLHEKERELQSEIARLGEEARVSGETEVGDLVDAATSSKGISESLQEDTLASQTLIQVLDALRRIEDGTYGKCVACGRPIEAARLEAIPWAPYCLEDQEKQEKAEHVPQGGSTL